MNERVQLLSGLFALATGSVIYFVKGRTWLHARYERRLRNSETFGEVRRYMASSSASIRNVHKSVLRLTLFGPTTSRVVHEQQLDAGKEYLELGGNGPAAAHYEVLYNDYMERSKNNDWDYERKEGQ